MNRTLYYILIPISILVIFACNSPVTPTAVPLRPALNLSVQAQNASGTSNTAGQTVTYQYTVTNTGNVPLVGPVTVTDDKVTVSCPGVETVGNLNNNLDPNESLNCTGTYTVSEADLTTGTVTNNATASAAGTNSNPATTNVGTATNNLASLSNPTPAAATPTPTSAFVPGSTIQHNVAKGDWLIQIARCYGADYQATRRANPQIINPSFIRINTTVTVPNIGSSGKIYGPPCVVYHTVQAGDTWTSIAQLYNADVSILQAANRGVSLTAGRVVKVPINSAGGSPQPNGYQTLTVNKTGAGTGTVASSPAGIDCGTTCAAAFAFNTAVTLTANPTAPSTFAGWSGGGCSGTALTCTVTMNQSQTVTATFNSPPGNQTLTVNKAGTGTGSVTSAPAGIDCGATCSAAFAFNTAVTLTANPTAPSTFAGWSGGGCSGTALTCVVTMNAAQTVTATFNTPGNPGLTVNKAGTGTGSVTSAPAGIDCGSTCSFTFPANTSVTLTANPTAPSTFAGWSGGPCVGTAAVCIVSITNAPQIVTATFNAPGDQTLTVNKDGTGTGSVTSAPAGIDCGATCSAAFAFNTAVILTANPTAPSTFAGWNGGGCSGTSLTCNVAMNTAQTVTATFNSSIGQTLTVNKAGAGKGIVTSQPTGINCDANCPSASFDFPINTAVTLTASTAVPFFTFDHWEGACSGTTTTCSVNMSQAQTVTASFRPLLSIDQSLSVSKAGAGTGTVSSAPAGIDCGATCSATFAFNAQVTLTANPTAPSTFAGWSGACSGTALTCMVTMNAAQNVIATFNSPGNQTLTVNKNGLGTVSSDPAGINCGVTCTTVSTDFQFDTEVTLTAAPLLGLSTFAGWSGGGCSGTALTCTVKMNQAQTVTAQFQ